jgi:hypothetical protein
MAQGADIPDEESVELREELAILRRIRDSARERAEAGDKRAALVLRAVEEVIEARERRRSN